MTPLAIFATFLSLIITLLLGWSYYLFPKVLRWVGAITKKQITRDMSYEPMVTLFIPAYNEEDVIEKKIHNALNLNYPQEKLEIMVCSDCSSDRTNEIVASLAQQYSQITFIPFAERSGKTGMINTALPQAKGEIILLTDANTMFMPTVVNSMVSAFSSEDIGAVLGRVDLFVPFGGKGLEKEVTYRAFETEVKYVEGLFGAALGAFGGLYAIRKDYFTPLPYNAYSNDDFLIPTRILAQGKSVVFDKEAISKEETGISIAEEFSRRIRIGAGNFQSVTFVWPLLNPFKLIRFFFYLSHKLIRWFSPFLLILLYLSTLYTALFIESARIYFALQTLFYSAALLGGLFYHHKRPLPFFQSAYHFCMINGALFLGFFRFIRGIKSATWSSIERSVKS